MSPADEAPGAIRVVTWNIHGGIGRDGRCDPDRILAILTHLRPDIAALQEVDGRVHLGRRPRAFERLAAGLGFHCAEARLTGRGDRAYGHLLWSRWPLGATLRILPGGRIEPRGAIDAIIRSPFGPIRVLAAHFGLVPADRRRQAAFVADLCRKAAGPTLALGDFNDWRLAGGSVHRTVGAALPVHAIARTWPARRPFVSMDRIYASSAFRLDGFEAADATAEASDHRALVANLTLTPA